MTSEERARSGQAPASDRRCVVCDQLLADGRCSHCGAAAVAGRYTIVSQIAQTARGRMYLAQDEAGSRVALKEIVFSAIPNLQQLESFRREARLLAELDHAGIPKFVASFEEGTGVATRLYLAQEYVEGESLAAEVARRRFEESEVLLLAAQVLEILVWLQRRSPPIFHRDLKPGNLIRRRDGTIALVDFGSARDTTVATLGATLDVGTYGYAPPEQLGGDVDATSDLYALGATLVHLLTRMPPREALAGAGLSRIGVSQSTRGLLEGLLAPLPQYRFSNAAEALQALRGAPSARTKQPAVSNRLLAAGAIVVAAAVVALAAFVVGPLFFSSSEPSPVETIRFDPEIESRITDGSWRDGVMFGRAIAAANPSEREIREILGAEIALKLAMDDGHELFDAQRAYRARHGQWLTFESADASIWQRLGIKPLDPKRQYSATIANGKLVVEVTLNGDRDAFLDRLQFRENGEKFDTISYAMDSVNFDYVTLSITAQPESVPVVHAFAATEARARQAGEVLEAVSRAQQIYDQGHGKFLLFAELTPEIAATLGVTLPSPLRHRHSAVVEDGKLVLRAWGNLDGDPALDGWTLAQGETKASHDAWDWRLVEPDD